MIALDFAYKKGTITLERYHELIDHIEGLAPLVEEILEDKDQLQKMALDMKDAQNAFYLGRGVDYTTAREAALKLKEISYIYTEAFAAGELKHGPIALIDEGTPVLAIVTQDALQEKMISNIKEVKARGAFVIAIAKKGDTEIAKVADDLFYIPQAEDLLMPVLAVIPTQLISYYVSIARGNDVDKPRNLAKSVTVE